MSQYTKSSSSTSYSALPFTLDGGSSQVSAAFNPMNFVQQMWKGFCVPNHDDAGTNIGDNSDDRYEQLFRSDGTSTTTKDIPVPRCIDLKSKNVNHSYNTSAIFHKDRQRLDSYEFDNCECKNTTTTSSMAVISHDSYDDDDVNADICSYRHDNGSYSIIKDEDAGDNDALYDEKRKEHAEGYIALTSGYTNRMTRITKGLGNFISALFFIALAMYMIQKLQEESPPYINHNFYVHSKINHESSFWRLHLK